jgi:hypothetical protein
MYPEFADQAMLVLRQKLAVHSLDARFDGGGGRRIAAGYARFVIRCQASFWPCGNTNDSGCCSASHAARSSHAAPFPKRFVQDGRS